MKSLLERGGECCGVVVVVSFLALEGMVLATEVGWMEEWEEVLLIEPSLRDKNGQKTRL